MVTNISGRRRKMKCNEARPECLNCCKSGYECEWLTQEKFSLPHGSDFKMRKAPKRIGASFIHYHKPNEQVDGLVEIGDDDGVGYHHDKGFSMMTHAVDSRHPVSSFLSEVSEPLHAADTKHVTLSTIVGLGASSMFALDTKSTFDDEIAPDFECGDALLLAMGGLSAPVAWIPGLDVPYENRQFLHAFVNGFVPSISPQHCHPQLTPLSVFMPQGVAEPLMLEVFYACGAAFMASGDPSLQVVSKRRYASCLNKFANRLAMTGGVIEKWMVAAALLFTLRDKFNGSSPEQPTLHLSKAVILIRTLREQLGDQSISIKVFVESCLFNYSMVLITGGKSMMQMLPSPFEIFEEWRPIYESKPFMGPVPWMNNPVFGAASRSFELAAKASWLVSKCPLNDEDMAIACDLLSATYRLKLPTIAVDHSGSIAPHEYVRLHESVAISELTRLGCQLLLSRMISPSLELDHDVVQGRIRVLISIFKSLSLDTPLWVVCGWVLLVTGLSCVMPEDRQFILLLCYRSARSCHAAFLVQIAKFMETAWGTDECPGPGWNLLFNTSATKSICL